MIVRDLIADIRQSLKKLTLDDRIPNQFIYSKLIKCAGFLIKRESTSRKIYKETNLFRPIPIELEDYNGVKRSLDKLPDFFTTNDGVLLMVGSNDYSNDFTFSNPQKFERSRTREFSNPNKRFFWIENGHLIIPDPYLEDVIVKGLFFNYKEFPCQSLLDTEFPCPFYLKEDLITMVVQTLLASREKLVQDEDPNLDTNKK